MSEPFIAEIRIVGFNFPPLGWAFCNGQILPIIQNTALFSLIGTIYGGDARTSFALPDLRGRTPIHMGDGHPLGQRGGRETITLTVDQIPAHTHAGRASSQEAVTDSPSGAIPAAGAEDTNLYTGFGSTNTVMLRTGTIANAGGGQSHNNMQPFIALSFCIALQGIFPPRD